MISLDTLNLQTFIFRQTAQRSFIKGVIKSILINRNGGCRVALNMGLMDKIDKFCPTRGLSPEEKKKFLVEKFNLK